MGSGSQTQERGVLQLIGEFQKGNSGALEEIFDQYKDQVFSLALHFCRNREVAEDITQTVFIKLLEKLGHFRGESEFTTWLYRIVKNTFMDYLRHMKHDVYMGKEEDLHLLSSDAPQQMEVERSRIRLAVENALLRLSPKLRYPLLLRYVAGLSYEEIAIILETTAGTVASRLHRGHLQMARHLQKFKNRIR